MANQTKGHIDQYLTNFSVRYANEGFVADILAPNTPVRFSSDKYIIYDKANFRISDNTYKSGTKAKEVNWEVSEGTYKAEEYALEHYITDQELKNYDAPQDAEEDGVSLLMDKHLLARENRVIQLATDTAVVTQTTTPSTKWSTPATATPKADIFTAIATIQGATGITPNKIIIPQDVALKLALCKEYTDDYKSGTDLIGTFGLPRILWGLQTVVVNTRYASTDQIGTSDPTLSSLWNKCVLIFYSDPTPRLKTVTFMKSFVPTDGTRRVIKGDYEKLKHGYAVQVYEEMDEKIVCAGCAYLLTACIA
jgi:hypothetical protein